MKNIETLSEDVYHVLDATEEHTADPALAAKYAMSIGGEMAKATVKRDSPRVKGKLWASDLGKRCLRQHWYNFNTPDKGEKLKGHTKFKFLYGNVLEEAVLYYAEEAGHKVTDSQRRVEVDIHGWTISGRIDGIVDNVLIDVKSTSSYGFKRYKDGINSSNDSFGYLEQLGFYVNYNDFGMDNTDAGFIWIDKQNGHVCYTPVTVPDKAHLEDRAKAIIDAVDMDEKDVPRGYATKPYGKSGNETLEIGCQYCSFKEHCYRESNNGQGLRGFYYNQGPVWFTKVAREPNVPEIGASTNGRG